MTLQEKVKSHIEQLSPHIKTRESATLLALCLGEMKLLEHENEQLSNMMGKLTDKNLESALTIERLENKNKELKEAAIYLCSITDEDSELFNDIVGKFQAALSAPDNLGYVDNIRNER